MAWVTANLLVLHKMTPVAHSCRLHRLPAILRLTPSRSDVVSLLTWINDGERPSKSRGCLIKTVHPSSEKTFGDVFFKKSLGSYVIQMLNIMS